MASRILIVEDEPLIAFELIEYLTGLGYDVTGPMADVASAMAALDATPFEAAVLDANLGRETSQPIAARLREDGVPFVVVTGYSRTQHPALFAGAPFLSKPVNIEILAILLKDLTAGRTTA